MTVIGIAMNDEAVIQEVEDVMIETVDAFDDGLGINSKDSHSMWIRKRRTNHQRQRLEIRMRAHRGVDEEGIVVVEVPMHQVVDGESSTGRSNIKKMVVLRREQYRKMKKESWWWRYQCIRWWTERAVPE